MRITNCINTTARLFSKRGYATVKKSTNDIVFHPGVVHPADTRSPVSKTTPEFIRKSRKRRLEIPLPPAIPKQHVDNLDVTANIYAWGNGSHGCLGTGYYRDVPYPQQILALQRIPIKHVASGWSHAVCVAQDGKMYRWGWIDDVKTTFTNANMKRRLPRVTLATQQFGRFFLPRLFDYICRDAATLEPQYVEELEGVPIMKAICGCGYTIALAEDGRVYSWGHGRWGNLGHPIFVTWTEIFSKPKLIDRLRDVKIVDIACGYVHVLFLDEDGGLWACGPGVSGRLGVGEGAARGEYPIPFQVSPVWEQRMHQVNRKIERRLRSRGKNVKIEDYIPHVVKIAAGHKHSAVVTDDGKLWTFGCGTFGALGHGADFTDKWWPTQVTALKDDYVIDIKCGQHHTVALTDKGEVWTFGMSRHGQCGRSRSEAFMLTKYDELGEDLSVVESSPPPEDDRDILVENDPLAMPPGKVTLPEGVIPYAIEAGWYQTSVIDQEGRLWLWGAEDGKLVEDPEPIMYEINPGIQQVDHGWLHTLAVTRESTSEQWERWSNRPLSDIKPEKPPVFGKEALLLASDDEDDGEEEEDITLFEAFKKARQAELEKEVKYQNIIHERPPEEDERRWDTIVEEREVVYQKKLAAEQARLAEAEEQKKLSERNVTDDDIDKEGDDNNNNNNNNNNDDNNNSEDETHKKE